MKQRELKVIVHGAIDNNNSMKERTAIIIGAGPAGLTAAYELLQKTDIKPVVFETTGDIGGISKTVNYRGNRIDIGGHRFFSKSDRVMSFWLNIMPLQGRPAKDDLLLGRVPPVNQDVLLQYHGKSAMLAYPDVLSLPDPEREDRVMLFRDRVSRIYFLRKFFDYPISLSWNTISNLGVWRLSKAAVSYFNASIFPVKDEHSLEHFLINRFGKNLYETFFKDYTLKVWGVPCSQIPAEWGAQRVKGLSIRRAVSHALRNVFNRDDSIAQKNTEATLITSFLYPKYGPGQMWEEVARLVTDKGGQIRMNHKVVGISAEAGRIVAVYARNEVTGQTQRFDADYVFSTMPVKDLIAGFDCDISEDVKSVAMGLMYRDFITVGLLLKRLKISNKTKIKTLNGLIPDNWIYIQEKGVRVGRLQIFNNWSPYMVSDLNKVWVGMEYFCNEGDDLWNSSDEQLRRLGSSELDKIGMTDLCDVLDGVVIRMPKTYPAYFGTYNQFEIIRRFTDGFENLFLIGRNGMHRYNNQDHSMLTAMTAVDNICSGCKEKNNIWAVNTEEQYHEEKSWQI